MDVRRPEQLKRLGGAASLGHIGTFPQNLAGIYQGRLRSRHVGRRGYPRQTRVRKLHVAFPAGHGNYFQAAADFKIIVKKTGQFADGQPMAHGDWIPPDKGAAVSGQAVALHINAVDGIRTIQDQNLYVVFCSRLETVGQGVDKRIHPAADILQVHQQHIDGLEHAGVRNAGLSVQAEYRDLQRRIDEIGRFNHIVLFFGEKSMLGRIQRL